MAQTWASTMEGTGSLKAYTSFINLAGLRGNEVIGTISSLASALQIGSVSVGGSGYRWTAAFSASLSDGTLASTGKTITSGGTDLHSMASPQGSLVVAGGFDAQTTFFGSPTLKPKDETGGTGGPHDLAVVFVGP
jgi:hypothetical protein